MKAAGNICPDAALVEVFGPNGRHFRRVGGIFSVQGVEIMERCVYNSVFDRVKLRAGGQLCIKTAGPHV